MELRVLIRLYTNQNEWTSKDSDLIWFWILNDNMPLKSGWMECMVIIWKQWDICFNGNAVTYHQGKQWDSLMCFTGALWQKKKIYKTSPPLGTHTKLVCDNCLWLLSTELIQTYCVAVFIIIYVIPEMNETILVLNWLCSHIAPFHCFCTYSISILRVCMSLTDGVALAGATGFWSNSWQGSPAGLCQVSICWAWPGVGLKRGREGIDQPCRQKDRMREPEEESGRTWAAALTRMEDGERRRASAVMLASFVTAIKKRVLERQISINI